MKKLFATMVVCLLGLSQLALAQGRIKAYAVDLETNGFAAIDLALPAQAPTNLASRYLGSAQHLAWWLDTWALATGTNLSGLAAFDASASTNLAGLRGDVDSLSTNVAGLWSDSASMSDYLTNSVAGSLAGLRSDFGTYQTNFGRVNINTDVTSNMFSIVGMLLGIPANTNSVAGSTQTVAQAYAAWAGSYLRMSTGGTSIPTNLAAAFPDVLSVLETNLTAAAQTLVASNANFYAFSAWRTNMAVDGYPGGRYFTIGGTGIVAFTPYNYRYAVAPQFGGAFSTNTGIFTAPEPGWYSFGATLLITNDLPGINVFAGMVKGVVDTNTVPDNALGSYWMTAEPTVSGELRLGGSVVYALAAGETVSLQLYRDVTGINTNVYVDARFHGNLLQRGLAP